MISRLLLLYTVYGFGITARYIYMAPKGYDNRAGLHMDFSHFWVRRLHAHVYTGLAILYT